MTDTAPAPSAPEPVSLAGQGTTIQPTLADVMNHLPEAGEVYVNLALTRWQKEVVERLAAQRDASKDQHIAALSAALLAAGVDPVTLQPNGAPEVGVAPAATATLEPSAGAHD